LIIEDHVDPCFVNALVVVARGEKDCVLSDIVLVDESTGLSTLSTAAVTCGVLDGIAGIDLKHRHIMPVGPLVGVVA
jgi:hypothetical protein